MNIFALDENPTQSARYLCDKHVVKMVLETAQIVSTAARVYHRYHNGKLYQPTHIRHPCVLWAGQTVPNMQWLLHHGVALSAEYCRRYGRAHRSYRVLLSCAGYFGTDHFSYADPPALAVDQDLKASSPYSWEQAVEIYREYYRRKAKTLSRFTYRAPSEKPGWLEDPAWTE